MQLVLETIVLNIDESTTTATSTTTTWEEWFYYNPLRPIGIGRIKKQNMQLSGSIP